MTTTLEHKQLAEALGSFNDQTQVDRSKHKEKCDLCGNVLKRVGPGAYKCEVEECPLIHSERAPKKSYRMEQSQRDKAKAKEESNA